MPRSTPEQRALAHELAAKGHTLGMIAYRVGFSVNAVRRWLKPEVAEQQRKEALAYRRENRLRLNANARRFMRGHKPHQCPACGRPTQNRVKACKSCMDDDREWIWLEIEKHWKDGRTIRQIAFEMRRSPESISSHVTRMRAAGRALPKRQGRRGTALDYPPELRG